MAGRCAERRRRLGGNSGAPSSIEETGLALTALADVAAADEGASDHALAPSLWRGARWLHEQTEGGRTFPPTPVGFYFARLRYFEREYPVIYCVAGLRALERWAKAATSRAPLP